MSAVRVAVVPGVLALLPQYAGHVDPVADLRAACLAAVGWLGPDVGVAGSPQGSRVARHLVEAAGARLDLVSAQPGALLVVANGTATRSERAPGHLDPRAASYDEDVRRCLTSEPDRLARLDLDLAAALWADVESLATLARRVDLDTDSIEIDYDDDPLGVQYWVARAAGRWRPDS